MICTRSGAHVFAKFGTQRCAITDEGILKQLLFASINKACKRLQDGETYCGSDIDVMSLRLRLSAGPQWADGLGRKHRRT